MLSKGLILFILGVCLTSFTNAQNNSNMTGNGTVSNGASVVTNLTMASITMAPTTACTLVSRCTYNCTVANTTQAAPTNSSMNATTVSPGTTASQVCIVSGACCNCQLVCSSVTNAPAGTTSPGAVGSTRPPPGTPPRPPTVPVAVFTGVDQRIPQILLSLFPQTYTTAASAVLSQSAFLAVFTALSSTVAKQILKQKPNTAIMFYQYLEDQIVLNGDNGTIVTQALIQLAVSTKPDCNFVRLLSRPSTFTGGYSMSNTNYTGAVSTFIQNILQYLPAQAAAQCRTAFPSAVAGLSGSLNASDPAGTASAIAGNPGLVSFMTPNQLKTLAASSSSSAIAIAQSLGSGGISLNPIMARALAQNIPVGTNINNISSIASGLPLSVLANQTSADLLNNLGKMDLGNMSPQRQTFIAQQIISGFLNATGGAASIASFLRATNNPNIIKTISTSQLSSLGFTTTAAVANISAVNLPKAFLKSLSRSTLNSATLDTIATTAANATLTYAQMIPGIVQSDILNISNAYTRVSTILNVVSSSNSEYVNLTSTQRAFMLNNLFLATASYYNLTNATKVAEQVMAQGTNFASLWPLLIEANSTILAQISQFSTFANVISSIASLSASQCCIFSLAGRTQFAAVATPYLFSYYNLILENLISLGPCLASVLPDAYFSQIGASVFVSYYSTLGNAFQPTVSQQAIATAYITQYLTNSTLLGTSTKDTLAFTTLGDLAIFYPWTSSVYSTMTDNSTWTSSGSTLLSTISAARSPSVEANQLCQAGLPAAATAAYITLIGNYASQFIYQYAFISSNGTATSRRKRATTTYTCSSLTSLGSPAIGKLSTTALQTLTTAEFYSCETLLGYAANGWSSAQLSILTNLALSYYSGQSISVPDADIANLNSIYTGLTASQLVLTAVTTFTTTTSISALGALTTWTTAQLATTALGVPITNYITNYLSGTITSTFLSAAGNLLCTLTQSQINGISTTAFSVSAVSSISVSCPNIAYWYAYAKTNIAAYQSLTGSASAISELGSVMAGISTADIALISADNIGSVTTSAWTYMPAATVNALSASQLAGLSTDQVTALINNPNAASFSSAITSSLASALGTTASSANIQSISMISLMISSLMAIFIFNL